MSLDAGQLIYHNHSIIQNLLRTKENGCGNYLNNITTPWSVLYLEF